VKSFFDPIYFIIIFTNSICTTDVVFLSILGEMKDYYTYTYLFSECALLSGILLLSLPMPKLGPSLVSPQLVQRLRIGMVFTMAIAIISTFVIYAERGIPMFLESRTDASAGGTGFGFVTRLSQVSIAVFVLCYYVKRKVTGLPSSSFERLMLLVSILFNLLSGFKTFFFFYLYAYLATRNQSAERSLKRDSYIFVGGTILVFILFSVGLDTTELDLVFAGLMSRIVASGDIYYMAFVNDTFNQLPSPQGFFHQLFGSLLASFRLIGWDEAPLNYGFVVNEVINKNDLLFGPTPRYNFIFLLITKSPFLTILLSFAVGLLIGGMNRILYQQKKLNFTFIFFAFFYYQILYIVVGPDAAISTIFLSLLIIIFIYIVVLLSHLQKSGWIRCDPTLSGK